MLVHVIKDNVAKGLECGLAVRLFVNNCAYVLAKKGQQYTVGFYSLDAFFIFINFMADHNGVNFSCILNS